MHSTAAACRVTMVCPCRERGEEGGRREEEEGWIEGQREYHYNHHLYY